MITIELVYNLSILVAITVVSDFIDDRWPRSTTAGQLAQGLLFGTAAVVGMYRPFVLTPGIFFDGRSMMLSLAALFFGPLAAAVAVPMALVTRLVQGGSGWVMGVSVILESAAVGLAFRHILRGNTSSLRSLHLLAFGLVVHVIMVLMMFLLPWESALRTIKTLGPIVLGLYPLATVLAGRVLADQEARVLLVEGLRRSDEQWRTLVANIPGVVYRCEGVHPWRLEYISDGVEDLTGRSPAAFLEQGVTWEELIDARDREMSDRGLSDGVASGTMFELEYRVRHRSGELRWVHEKGQAVRGPDGKVAWVDGVIIDITDRKWAEEALQRSEARWQFALEEAGDGLWDWDLTTDQVFYSRRWKETLGYEEHEIGDTLAEWDSRVHPDDRARAWERLERHIRGEARMYEHEHRLRHKDGSYRWMLDRGRVIERRADGSPSRMIGAHVDITARRRADEERLEMERRLLHGQKLESLGVLAGGIAHDFNNLLTAILGNLELGLGELPKDSPARDAFMQAVQASRRATDLTRQMLAYSGRGQFVMAPLDLNALVRENVGLFRASVNRSVTLELRLTEGVAPILADAGQVQQVVMNLITNASEAIGDAPGMVTLSTCELECSEALLAESRVAEKPAPGRYVCLEVQDDGCGMDEATKQRLFDPFFTTKFTGRGLGLSALLGIVRGHKGAVMVNSEEGRGTRVRVLIPAAARASAEVAEPEAAQKGPGRGVPGGTVLVVEDEPPVRQLAARILAHLGYRVVAAEDGDEALELLRQAPHSYLCVLLDLTMPRRDGVSTFREIKQIRPDLPVILCSGFSQADATNRFTEEGLAGFLQKPYGIADLREKLAGLPSA